MQVNLADVGHLLQMGAVAQRTRASIPPHVAGCFSMSLGKPTICTRIGSSSSFRLSASARRRWLIQAVTARSGRR